MTPGSLERASRPHANASDEAAIALLCDLVATPSVSGEEAAAVQLFVRAASEIGLDAEIDAAGNGVARRGAANAARTIVLLGHIDTVPGDVPVRLENGVLHGRGSVDAKGPLATMLVAAARADLPAGVAVQVIAAVGEEAASPGARFIAAAPPPDACVIGEPSGWDGVTLGYKGCVNVRARATRPATHSANPQATAPDVLAEWWRRVQEFAACVSGVRSPVFEQLQASITSWSSRSDGCDDRAAMCVNFRLPPSISPSVLRRELLAMAGDDVELEIGEGESAYVTGRDDIVVAALSGAIRDEGGTPRHKRKTGTADFNIVGPAWRCPIAAYGPGDSRLDHTPHEHVLIDDYLRAIRVMQRAIETLADRLVRASVPRACSCVAQE